MAAEKEESQTKPAPISLLVFQHLEEAQSSHGVPIADYSQYHAYCSKKLARLIHNKAVRTQLVHNPKYVEGVSGRRHAYCARNDNAGSNIIEHENIFWNLFFQAERAWAQACALQQQSTKPAVAGRKSRKVSNHAYVQRRLNKAAKWARAFAEKVASSNLCDDSSVKESQSYSEWMAANVALEHKQYATAFRHYKNSMTILLELADQIETSASVQALAIRDIWTQRAETVIKPLLRYCQYEAKDELTAQDLQEATTAALSKDAESGNDSIVLSFRGLDIALDADDSYKPLAVLYLKMENSLKHPDLLDESQFLQLLSDLDDAVQMVADEIKKYESIGSAGPAVTAKLADLSAVQGYFRYRKYSSWSHQQELRVAELQSDAEIVHLYDALQRNALAMAGLPASNDDDPYRLEAQAHVVRIRALRCYHLARLYETSGTPQQVLALLRQSLKLTKRAMEEIAACDMAEGEADRHLNALDDLFVKIGAMKCRVEATKFLEASSASSGGSSKTDRPLWLRLEDLDTGVILADEPPLPIPMPCKGSFYDMAGQHVLGDNEVLLSTLESYIDANQPKKRGFLGWF